MTVRDGQVAFELVEPVDTADAEGVVASVPHMRKSRSREWRPLNMAAGLRHNVIRRRRSSNNPVGRCMALTRDPETALARADVVAIMLWLTVMQSRSQQSLFSMRRKEASKRGYVIGCIEIERIVLPHSSRTLLPTSLSHSELCGVLSG